MLMTSYALNPRPLIPKLLVIAPAEIATVNLFAHIPYQRMAEKGLLQYRFRDEEGLEDADIYWADTIIAMRCCSIVVALQLTLARAHAHGKNILSFWDDDFLAIPTSSLSYAHFSKAGIKRWFHKILALSDAIIVINENLGKKLSAIASKPYIMQPMGIDAIVEAPPQFAIADNFVLGFAGSADHADALQTIIMPALEQLWATGAQFRFEVIGSRSPISGRFQHMIKCIPATQNYADWLALRSRLNWHATLAVLPQSEFHGHKFYNKLVEFGAAGIPCVYSNVAPYKGVVRDGEEGILCDTTADAFAAAITRLFDPTLRNHIALTSWQFVRDHHTPEATNAQWFAILKPYLKLADSDAPKSHAMLRFSARVLQRAYRVKVAFWRWRQQFKKPPLQ
jgi:glycosyltransferase involved in cell wall biosynthesis